MRSLVTFLMLLSTVSVFAQVKYLTASGLNIEVQSAQVGELKTRDVPWDKNNTYNVITFANLELTLKISDEECGLKEESTIFSKYTEASTVRRLEFYLSNDEAQDAACTFSSKVIKFETIKLPLINGLSLEADKDVECGRLIGVDVVRA